MQFVYPTAQKIISEKLLGNKSLSEHGTKLKFPINIVHVFPSLKRNDVEKTNISNMANFVRKQCLFSEEFSELRLIKKIAAGYVPEAGDPLG